jgi:hypothetical protein
MNEMPDRAETTDEVDLAIKLKPEPVKSLSGIEAKIGHGLLRFAERVDRVLGVTNPIEVGLKGRVAGQLGRDMLSIVPTGISPSEPPTTRNGDNMEVSSCR